MTEAELQRLIHRAGEILARRPYSQGELAAKLSKLGEPQVVDLVLARLRELGLLNDADYAYNFALNRLKHEGWGPRKVHDSLIRRYVPPALIESTLVRIRQELRDGAILESYLEKHCRKTGLPSDRKEIRRLVLHLRRRGFLDEEIFNTLRQKISPVAWERFETGD